MQTANPAMISPVQFFLHKNIRHPLNLHFISASRFFSEKTSGPWISLRRRSGHDAAVHPPGPDTSDAREVRSWRDSLQGNSPEEEDEGDGTSWSGMSRVTPSASGSGIAWGSATRRKSGKVKVNWVCENCGATPGQWWGTCPSCQAVNTVKKFTEYESAGSSGFRVSEAVTRSWLEGGQSDLAPQSLEEVKSGMNKQEWRIPLPGSFGMEVSRVLGGGLVPGSLILFGGDPGIGKSTLLLQIAACLAEGLNSENPAQVLYVSGEESMDQIGNRADRMQIHAPGLYLYSSTEIEDIMDKVRAAPPKVLVIDSIQTVYLRGVIGSAGNVVQVKECTSALLRFAKQSSIPVLLIGHVTKSGDIAGPRMLEHIVDVVLYLEGERCSTHRLLRSVKNRFGSTDELGVFEMSETGLQAALNPSELFLSENRFCSEVLAGLAITVILDGSRVFLLEIQALCVTSESNKSVHHFSGVSSNRGHMIISVLMKQARLKLQGMSVFVNVVSGFSVRETAGDLALAAAIASSLLEFPVPNNVAFIGEVGLAGELRTVPRMDKRVMTVAKLGYTKCVVPASGMKSLAGLHLDTEIVPCSNLTEVIHKIFR